MYTKFREELSPSSFLRSIVPLYYVEKIKRALFAVAIWPVFKTLNDREFGIFNKFDLSKTPTNPNYHMAIKKSQAILKCFIDLKSSVWCTLGSANEKLFCET